jgi:hypothetical protein
VNWKRIAQNFGWEVSPGELPKVTEPKKMVLCFIPTMKAGGAECAMALLVNDLVAKGHDVKLVTIDRSNIDAFYPLDKRVVQIELGSHRAVVCRDFNFLFMHSERRK